MTLTVGSLFSGIGGIDLGLERAGMTVKWQSEIDPFACKVLKKHWPNIPNLGDIKTVDWSTVEPVDLIAGGYPCQPFSTAGKRQGENDPRHLWPYFRNAISAIRPKYALLENVRGHLSMGATAVVGDLAEIGYDCQWQVVSAASVGAPHRRDRVIIVAYPQSQRSDVVNDYTRSSLGPEEVQQFRNDCGPANVADTDSCDASNGGQCSSLSCQGGSRRDDGGRGGSDSWEVSLGGTGETPSDVADTNDAGSGTSECGIDCDWSEESQERKFAQFGSSGCSSDVANTKKQCCNGRRNGDIFGQSSANWLQGTVGRKGGFGRFTNWETEPDVGRVADGVPFRVDRLRGLGNAVVPQVAEYVGQLILQSQV